MDGQKLQEVWNSCLAGLVFAIVFILISGALAWYLG